MIHKREKAGMMEEFGGVAFKDARAHRTVFFAGLYVRKPAVEILSYVKVGCVPWIGGGEEYSDRFDGADPIGAFACCAPYEG
jgi:hypothetical protein